jgi:hypothetical protein
METKRITNLLLFLIFLSLVVLILTRSALKDAAAETFKLDSCITTSPYDKPAAYVHVVIHNVSPIQSGSDLR